jgi:hypothetical protein
MESQKLIEIANDVENKSNKDLMIVADELNEEFEKTPAGENCCPMCRKPGSREIPLKFGPQIASRLVKTNVEKCSYAVIGKKSLLNLPLSLHHAVNLGIMGTTSYDTTFSFKAAIDTSERSLYNQLLQRIKILESFRFDMPIVIEFDVTSEQKFEQIPIEECLFGFLKVVSLLQKQYSGALIVTCGPILPYTIETLDRYTERKADLQRYVKFAHFLGNIFGIPIAHARVQTIFDQEVSSHMGDKYWMRTPLFDSKAVPTVEFYHRLGKSLNGIALESNRYARWERLWVPRITPE